MTCPRSHNMQEVELRFKPIAFNAGNILMLSTVQMCPKTLQGKFPVMNLRVEENRRLNHGQLMPRKAKLLAIPAQRVVASLVNTSWKEWTLSEQSVCLPLPRVETSRVHRGWHQMPWFYHPAPPIRLSVVSPGDVTIASCPGPTGGSHRRTVLKPTVPSNLLWLVSLSGEGTKLRRRLLEKNLPMPRRKENQRLFWSLWNAEGQLRSSHSHLPDLPEQLTGNAPASYAQRWVGVVERRHVLSLRYCLVAEVTNYWLENCVGLKMFCST